MINKNRTDAKHSATIFLCSYWFDLSTNGKLQKGQVQKGHKACGIRLFVDFNFINNTKYVKGHYDKKLQ